MQCPMLCPPAGKLVSYLLVLWLSLDSKPELTLDRTHSPNHNSAVVAVGDLSLLLGIVLLLLQRRNRTRPSNSFFVRPRTTELTSTQPGYKCRVSVPGSLNLGDRMLQSVDCEGNAGRLSDSLDQQRTPSHLRSDFISSSSRSRKVSHSGGRGETVGGKRCCLPGPGSGPRVLLTPFHSDEKVQFWIYHH